MTDSMKKLLATVIVSGSIVGGGFYVSEKLNCDYTVEHKGKEVCLDAEVKEILDEGLKSNSGFGGVQFK